MADLLLTLPPDDIQARTVRAEVQAWFQREGLSMVVCEDAVLVASELFSNAARSAAPGTSIGVRVTRAAAAAPVKVKGRAAKAVLVDGHGLDRVSIEITNIGPGFDPAGLPSPASNQSGGRGVAIVRALGSLAVEQHGDRTVVRSVLG